MTRCTRFYIALVLSGISGLSGCLDGLETQSGSYKPLPKGVELSSVSTLLAQAKVLGVSDGDTLSVRGSDGHTYKLRLQGIDAPEKAQAYGRQCKDVLAKRVLHQTVAVEAYKLDRYGRILAKVKVRGTDVALEQIRAGCGWHYSAYAKEQAATDRADYAYAERQARQHKQGLWQGRKPQAPWDFRHRAQ